MTVTEAAPSAPVDARGSTLPGRIWWTVAAVVLVGAVVLLYALVGRRTVQAHSLLPYFDVNESGPLQVGATMVVGGDVQPLRAKSGHRVLDIRAAVPDITVNRAHASVRIWECTLADSHSGIGMGYLSDATKTCAKFHPFRPGPRRLRHPSEAIKLMTDPAEVHVYPLPSNGWQDGGSRAGRYGGALHITVDAAQARAWLGDRERLVLWPAGWQVRIGSDAAAELIAPDGSVFASEGDLIVGAGAMLSKRLARERFGLDADDPLAERSGWSLTRPKRVNSLE